METEDFKFYLPIYVGIINLWDIFVVVGEIFIVADIFIAIIDIFIGGEIFIAITNSYWIKGNASWTKIWHCLNRTM